MIDATLSRILVATFSFGACGALAAIGVSFLNRKTAGPRIDQVAAVGFLVGAAFGACIGIFQSMLARV